MPDSQDWDCVRRIVEFVTREETNKLIDDLRRKQTESEEELRKVRDEIHRLTEMLQRKIMGETCGKAKHRIEG
jgi:hypothetical protein